MANSSSQRVATRPLPVSLDDEGNEHSRSVYSPTGFKVRGGCLVLPRLVVPVVFLPGVMGTRLRMKDRPDQSAWIPPENTWQAICALFSYLGKNAARRQEMLDPDNTEVDPDGPCRPDPDASPLLATAPGANPDEQAVSRGWGAAHGASYGKGLSALELQLAHVYDYDGSRPMAYWDEHILAVKSEEDGKKRLGAEGQFVPLTEGELWVAAQAAYPVHVVGYNWLKSNADSAEYAAAEIDKIVAYYASRKRICEKVIVVTHSMGGLVARALALLPGMQDKILGVVHGVQPAIGAPAAYKRFRAGFEGIEQVVLGRDAAECTAVLAHAAGPMELLPHADYQSDYQNEYGTKGQRHWLRASHLDAQGRERNVMLGEGDPFDAIYSRNEDDCWWRLVKEELIDPAGDEKRKKRGLPDDPRRDRFGDFRTVLERVRELHDKIQKQYHPTTYAFYAADAKQLAWSELHWQSTSKIEGKIDVAPIASDDLNGKVRLALGGAQPAFRIQPASGPGDGTVPAESGRAPGEFALMSFRHEGDAAGHESYDHQNAFSARESQAVTLYSIAKIAIASDWFQENIEDS